ncbi:MAG: phosphoribosylaminoimidazolesuccinocarboxamide synthase [Actinobacteria bacterium]|nr:phosphoribosylaminoimidazolesuccinocarboxamide synthase [Actinomycetota bacterium]
MRSSIGLPLNFSGKVRDIYDAGDDRLLLVTSDRISAFDVVMAEVIPDKGRALTAMTAYWFDHLDGIVDSHLISTSIDDLPDEARDAASDADLEGRIMLCRKAEMFPIECVVRGYITGSAWKEYAGRGTMHGTSMPAGLVESQQLDEPVFTPAAKAEVGEHDENIDFDRAVSIVGADWAERLRDVSLELYRRGAALASERGLIVADTKFEFGLIDGELVLCDEVLTPDSSRFWAAAAYEPGHSQESFDKQPLRDWLDGLDWDKTPPPPTLPDEVVAATRDRYVEAYELVTGRQFVDWPGVATA